MGESRPDVIDSGGHGWEEQREPSSRKIHAPENSTLQVLTRSQHKDGAAWQTPHDDLKEQVAFKARITDQGIVSMPA
jgi:hypothetical protein